METSEISMEQLEAIANSDNKIATGGERVIEQSEDNSPDNLPTQTVFVGSEDYSEPDKIIWFELANKAFPTKRTNPFFIMKLAKAQNDYATNTSKEVAEELETRIMGYTYELIMAMIPKRYHLEFEAHMQEAEYSDDEMNKAIENSMTQWANRGENVIPLATKNAQPGPSTPPSELLTLKEVSLHSGAVKERPLTDQERQVHQQLMKKKAVEPNPPQ